MGIRPMGNNYKPGSASSEFGDVTISLYLDIQFLKESRLHQVKREGSPGIWVLQKEYTSV